MLCSLPGVSGSPGAGVGHGRYPCKPVSRFHDCQGPWSWWFGSSFPWGSFPSCEGLMGSLSFGAGPKDSMSFPYHYYIGGCKGGGGGDITGGISSLRPLWGHHWSLRNLHAPDGSAGDLPSPVTSLNWHFLSDPSSKSTWRALTKCTSVGSAKAYLQLGFNGVLLPSGISRGPSSLFPAWDELFRPLKILSVWQRDPKPAVSLKF